MFSSSRMFKSNFYNDLFDKSSWSSSAFPGMGSMYRRCLDKAADRWAKYIKYNDSVRSSIVSEVQAQLSQTWNGLRLEPNNFAMTEPTKTYSVNSVLLDGSLVFLLNGSRPTNPPYLVEGRTYTFDFSTPTNSGHVFRFSSTQDGVHNGGSAYSSGVTVSGTPGSPGSFVRIVPSSDTPRTLYYYCTNHPGMGGSFSVMDNSTIAAAYVYYYKNLGSKKFNSISFGLIINGYYETIYSENNWSDILAHELGHALGIGLFWRSEFSGSVPPQDNFLDGSAYTNCLGGYRVVTSNNGYSKIPLESTGSQGTNSAHWEDTYRDSSAPGAGGMNYLGLENELMVGYVSPISGRGVLGGLISDVSLKVMKDFGYEERVPGTNEGVPSLATVSSFRSLGSEVRIQCFSGGPHSPKEIGS